jgi:putative transposase
MDWKKLLGSITESVDEELRLRNAYLAVENRILRQQLPGRIQLCDSDRKALAEIGKQLSRKALAEVATIAQPDTILAWYRTLVVQQCERVQPRKSAGRPRMAQEIEDVVVRMARENRSWGYDRIVGAAKNLGYAISDQTVGNILKRHGIPPAPERTKTLPWREFIRIHLAVLRATGFFTTEVWSRLWLVLSSCLMFFLCLNCHAICITAIAALRHTCGMLSRLRWCRPWHAAAERWGVLVRERGWSRLPPVVQGSVDRASHRVQPMIA